MREAESDGMQSKMQTLGATTEKCRNNVLRQFQAWEKFKK
jgi:hypothetical protein